MLSDDLCFGYIGVVVIFDGSAGREYRGCHTYKLHQQTFVAVCLTTLVM